MDSAHREQIAAAIRSARRAKGLTQEALAERINRTSASLSNLERAQALPSLDTLVLIAAALDIPIGRLLESPARDRRSRSRVREENEMIDLIRSLSPDQLRIARIQIEALVSTSK